MNLYGLIDSSLKQLIEERDMWFVRVHDVRLNDSRPDPFAKMAYTKYQELDKTVNEVRAKIFNSLDSYDRSIQEKIAELALTDNK